MEIQDVPNYALQAMVMKFLIWNDIYNHENDNEMKNIIIEYFIDEGIENPVEHFTEIHKMAVSMATSALTLLNVYIKTTLYYSSRNILNRVIDMLKIKYSEKLIRLYQEYQSAKVENNRIPNLRDLCAHAGRPLP